LEVTEQKKEESALAESSATEEPPVAGKTPPGGFVEDGLEAQPISSKGKAGPGWESIGEARDEESGADAEHGTLRQTKVSERPEGKQRLSTQAHGAATCLPTPRLSCKIVILVTRSTPSRGGRWGTRDPLRDIRSSCVLEGLRRKLLASAQQVRWDISQGMEALLEDGTTKKMPSAYLS